MSSIMRKVLLLILLPIMTISLITSIIMISSIYNYLAKETYKDLLIEAEFESSKMEKTFSRIEASINILSFAISNQFQREFYSLTGDVYLENFRNQIAPLILQTAQSIKNCKGVYFMFAPDFGSLPNQVWYNDRELNGNYKRIVEFPDPEDFNENDENMEYYYYPIKNKENYWSNPYVDNDLEISLISYTVPVYSNSKIIGVAGIDLTLTSIENALKEYRYLDSGYAFLINSKGQMIYHPHFLFNTPIEEALGEEQGLLIQELTSENSSNTIVYTYQNIKKRLGYIRMSNQWLLAITTTEKEMFAPIKNLIIPLFFTSIIILVLSIAISYIIARFISYPVELLTSEIKKSVKDFDSIIDNPQLLNRKDELGKLSQVFKELQQAYSDTMQRIINDNVTLERMTQLGDRVGEFTHEIKTPIGVVLTALTFSNDLIEQLNNRIENNNLKKSALTNLLEQIKTSNEMCLKNIDQSKKVIDSFKNVAISQIDLKKETIILHQLVNDVASSLLMGQKNKKITFKNNIRNDIHLETKSGYLTQIFMNLIQNSITHGFLNVNSGIISVNCHENSKSLIIDYSDNGQGIPREISNEIFKPYFTSARERGGSGLGLHIIQTIIHTHLGGSITLIEPEKSGVMFRISLPK